MKLTRTEILKMASKEPHIVDIKRADLSGDPYLLGIKDTKGQIYFDLIDEDKISARIKVEGMMICPCAMTLEEVDVPYTLDEEVIFADTDEDDDAYPLFEELDIDDLLLQLVLPNAPIKVVKEGKIEYPIGDGWRVLSEDMLKDLRRNEIDPRLAKLKEYKFDDEKE